MNIQPHRYDEIYLKCTILGHFDQHITSGVVFMMTEIFADLVYWKSVTVRTRVLVQATIYRRLRIGRDGHLDQSEAYDCFDH